MNIFSSSIPLRIVAVLAVGLITFAITRQKAISSSDRIVATPTVAPLTLLTDLQDTPVLRNEEAFSLETEALRAWVDRFQALLREHASREDAEEQLFVEMDASYLTWIREELLHLADQLPLDRYECLVAMETEIDAGSAYVLRALKISGNQQLGILRDAREALAAERDYADHPISHESRIALLRLDQERGERYSELVSVAGKSPDAQALQELDDWYDQSLGLIIGTPRDEDTQG